MWPNGLIDKLVTVAMVSLHTRRARYVDKSNGYGVEIENCFTLGVIGVAVSGPEEATSGLAKLLPVARQPLPVRRKPQILPFELASKQSESLMVAKSTPGDLRRQISTSCGADNSLPFVG